MSYSKTNDSTQQNDSQPEAKSYGPDSQLSSLAQLSGANGSRPGGEGSGANQVYHEHDPVASLFPSGMNEQFSLSNEQSSSGRGEDTEGHNATGRGDHLYGQTPAASLEQLLSNISSQSGAGSLSGLSNQLEAMGQSYGNMGAALSQLGEGLNSLNTDIDALISNLQSYINQNARTGDSNNGDSSIGESGPGGSCQGTGGYRADGKAGSGGNQQRAGKMGSDGYSGCGGNVARGCNGNGSSEVSQAGNSPSIASSGCGNFSSTGDTGGGGCGSIAGIGNSNIGSSGNGTTSDTTTSGTGDSTTSGTGDSTTSGTGDSTTSSTSAAAGQFTVENGQIIGPNGQPFVAKGINIYDSQVGDLSQILQTDPEINMIRLAVQDPSTANMSQIQQFINTATSDGIVVDVEDHVSNQTTASGCGLAQQESWYSQLAAANKDNPYVWFGTPNEPTGSASAIATQEQGIYNAIRSAGNNNMVLLEVNAATPENSLGSEASIYQSMTNVAWDQHFYGWMPTQLGESASSALSNIVSSDEAFSDTQGSIPVVIGEYGPSTDGNTVDSNAEQVVDAVQSSGLGSLAFAWNTGVGDTMTSGCGALTSWGQEVKNYIDSGTVGNPE